MNTANNRRKKNTVEKTEMAFVELLQTKNLEEITISELCRKAGINRTTFYASYDGLHSIADSIRKKLEDSMRIYYKHESHDFTQLFQHVKKNQDLYRTYFKLGYDDRYDIVDYDREIASRCFGNRFVHYHIEFFKAGLTKLIKLWLEGGCEESPEEMMDILKSEYSGRSL